jgi:hypothetical protein
VLQVPCFGHIVDAWRRRADKRDGMQRFLIKVAMAMTPAVYVPSERPPALRLYMVSQGTALYRGERLRHGDSWGAQDVMLVSRGASKAYRAVSHSYLHVLWLDAAVFEALRGQGVEFTAAYQLLKLWAVMCAPRGLAHRACVSRHPMACPPLTDDCCTGGRAAGTLSPRSCSKTTARRSACTRCW